MRLTTSLAGAKKIDGFSLWDSILYGGNYEPFGFHSGVDFYARSGSSVYSIADQGIVVGIGIGHPGDFHATTSSGNLWGAAYTDESRYGFNIIVRYSHFYVLFGHLRELDPAIYVGKRVDHGVRLGAVGTVNTAHLHLEVRNLGASITPAQNALVLVSTNPFITAPVYDQGNKYGILKLGGGQAGTNVYDIGQFFFNNITAYAQDYDSNTSPQISIVGFGPNLKRNDNVQFGAACPIKHNISLEPVSTNPPSPAPTQTPIPKVPTVPPSSNPGFRGFVLGQPAFQSPINPFTDTNQPSIYPTSTP